MTQLADFVVINTDPAPASQGKWKSDPFESGGRLIRTVNGVEQDNAYVTLTLTSTEGGQGVSVRVIVNNNPLRFLVEVKANYQRTAVTAFPASFLRDGNDNVLELHSSGEIDFIVLDTICHFRQNS
jgi:hypothetical protein